MSVEGSRARIKAKRDWLWFVSRRCCGGGCGGWLWRGAAAWTAVRNGLLGCRSSRMASSTVSTSYRQWSAHCELSHPLALALLLLLLLLAVTHQYALPLFVLDIERAAGTQEQLDDLDVRRIGVALRQEHCNHAGRRAILRHERINGHSRI